MIGLAKCLIWLPTRGAHRQAAEGAVLFRPTELYGIGDQVRGKPPDLRRQIRQEQALPLLVDFEAWLRLACRRFRRNPTPPMRSTMG